MRPALAIVIVNYNAGCDLRGCLSSIAEHLTGFDWKAVVIDNCSTDGSEQAVASFAPRVSLVQNTQNLGFARAINQGMAATTAPFVLLLNPDARLLSGAVESMYAELLSHPECGVIGPAIVNEDGSIQGSARGDPDMITGLFGRSTLLTRLFPRSALARRNVMTSVASRPGETSVEVDWVSGASMLLRRDVFNQVGGFDERFFLYWEDADFCRRVRTAGSRVRYHPDARVVHAVGRSSRTIRALAVREFHRSAYLYYSLHVARSRWHPARWMAFVLLRARCWWVMKRRRYFTVTRQKP
jgi:GT2 family glycosyltransferase